MANAGEGCSFIGSNICTPWWLTTRAAGVGLELEKYDQDTTPGDQRLPVGVFACRFYVEQPADSPERSECGNDVVCDGVNVSVIGGSCLMDAELETIADRM